MSPPAAPAPLPLPAADSGMLRWTPVEGADAYEVWLIDIPKKEVVFTNVLDEREFYTFHRDAQWTGTVRWRIRALRIDSNPQDRANGLPAVGYGPWSPVYLSTNSAYNDESCCAIPTPNASVVACTHSPVGEHLRDS